MGPLTIGSNTLNITGGSGVLVTLGDPTVSGSPTFGVAAGVTLALARPERQWHGIHDHRGRPGHLDPHGQRRAWYPARN